MPKIEPRPSIRGRGSAHNPQNRFLPLAVEREAWTLASDPDPKTEVLEDRSKSIISWNDSPDLGFDASLNPYRGCETGCSYCYARPTHEYLGMSAGLNFESRIVAKPQAPELLRKTLASPKWKPQLVVLSGVTDPYQPLERRLGITRGCLEALAEARNPVRIMTKHHLVTRDIDVLQELARYRAVQVQVSITTLDRKLQGKMEPRGSTPERRMGAIRRLAEAGIPAGVNVAPVIPGLTDHEIPSIIEAAAEAGATRAMHVILRLPFGVAGLFEDWQGAEPHEGAAGRQPLRAGVRRADARPRALRRSGLPPLLARPREKQDRAARPGPLNRALQAAPHRPPARPALVGHPATGRAKLGPAR